MFYNLSNHYIAFFFSYKLVDMEDDMKLLSNTSAVEITKLNILYTLEDYCLERFRDNITRVKLFYLDSKDERKPNQAAALYFPREIQLIFFGLISY